MAGEAKPTDSPTAAAPAAAAPPAPSSDSPPAAAPAAADLAPAAPEASAAAAALAPAAAEPAPTLLQQFDKDTAAAKEPAAQPAEAAKPAEGEKPAEGDKPKEGAADAKPEAKADAKAADAKPAEKPAEAKPAEAKPAEAAKPEPVAYEYALPETIKLDDVRKGEFHAALDAFRADPSKGAQPLIDLHNKAMTEYAAQIEQNQRDVWNETRKGWQTEAMADEQIGGAGYQTAMGVIARMRDLFVPEAERKSFDSFLQITGAGDHPAFLKMLHRAGRYFDEPPMPPANVKPSPTNGQNPNGRRAAMYDHPRSNLNRQQ